jgi:hypothetical protein
VWSFEAKSIFRLRHQKGTETKSDEFGIYDIDLTNRTSIHKCRFFRIKR